ncbi:MAG: FliM/FliN family flagellar motor switch protein [Alteripontixanthobacter sp.]
MSIQTPIETPGHAAGMGRAAQAGRGFDFLRNVDVCLSVELGRTEMKLKDVMTLGEDSVVPLDRLTDELLDVFVNGKPIAKAEVITEGNRFALKIVEMVGDDDGGDDASQAGPVPTPVPADVQAELGGQG